MRLFALAMILVYQGTTTGLTGNIISQCASNLANVSAVNGHSGSLLGWYQIGVGILHTISAHDNVPYDTIKSMIDHYIIDDDSTTSASPVTQDTILGWARSIFRSQTGYIVAFAFGLLFIVIMPIAGIIFACCRCCDLCGGKRYHDQPQSWCCITLVILCLAAILAFISGMTLYGLSNQHSWNTIPQTRDDVIAQVDNIAMYGNSTVEQMICGIEGTFSYMIDTILNALSSLPHDTMNKILKQTGMTLMNATQEDIDKLVSSQLPSTIETVNLTMTKIQQYQSDLTQFLSGLPNGTVSNATKQSIDNELASYVNRTFLDSSYNTFLQIKSFSEVPDHNFTTQLTKPVSDLQDVVAGIDDTVESIRQTMKSVNSSINDALADAHESVGAVLYKIEEHARDFITNNLSDEKLDPYSWIPTALLVFMLPVLVIVLLLLGGMICGITNYGKDDIPYKRSSWSNHGGNCEMAAVAICFIFGSILMLLTVVLFTIGYAVEGFACQPLFEDEAKPMYDLITHVVEETTPVSDFDYKPNVYGTLIACKNNEAAYTALNLSQVVDLDELVENVSTITINPSDFTGFNDDDFYTIPQGFADQIEQRAIPLLESLSASLEAYRSALLKIPSITMSELKMLEDLSTLSDSQHKEASNLTARLQQWVQGDRLETISAISASVNLITAITTNLNQIIDLSANQSKQNHVLQSIMNSTANHVTVLSRHVTAYSNKAIHFVEHEIGPCGPLYTVLQNVGVIVCKNLLYTVHGLWLGMGWCLLWFILAIPFAAGLAKYLHRMNKAYYMDSSAGISDKQILDAYNMPTLQISSRVHPTYEPYQRRSSVQEQI